MTTRSEELVELLMQNPIEVSGLFQYIEGKNVHYKVQLPLETDQKYFIGHYTHKRNLPDDRILRVYFCKIDDGKERMPNDRLEIYVKPSEKNPIGFQTMAWGLERLSLFRKYRGETIVCNCSEHETHYRRLHCY